MFWFPCLSKWCCHIVFRIAYLYLRGLYQDISQWVCMVWFHVSCLLVWMLCTSMLIYNWIVTQFNFVKLVVLHMFLCFIQYLLFLYLCGACCHYATFFVFCSSWWTLKFRELEFCCVFVGNVFFDVFCFASFPSDPSVSNRFSIRLANFFGCACEGEKESPVFGWFPTWCFRKCWAGWIWIRLGAHSRDSAKFLGEFG